MKRLVQPQAVREQVGTERIRRTPADVFAEVGRADRKELLEQGDHDEKDPGDGERPVRAALRRGVDETPQDLRVEQLQPDAAEQQKGQDQHPRPLWPEVTREQTPASSK